MVEVLDLYIKIINKKQYKINRHSNIFQFFQ